MGIFARPNVPDMPPKRTLKMRLGVRIEVTYITIIEGERTRACQTAYKTRKPEDSKNINLYSSSIQAQLTLY